MNRVWPLIAACGLWAGTAAADPAADLLGAAEVDLGDVHNLTEWGDGAMREVVTSLGAVQPALGPDMALIYTGNINNIFSCTDDDMKPYGIGGDQVGFSFDLDVPQGSHSMVLAFMFLTREYPDFVGSAYTDFFDIYLQSMAWVGHIAVDPAGDVITVNYVDIIYESGDPELNGTGFDGCDGTGRGGGTGWLLLTAPVVGGETISLEFDLAEQSDGIYDSAILFDGIQFSPWNPLGNFSVLADPPAWTLSPTSGDVAGGNYVDLNGVALTHLSGLAFGGAASTNHVIHNDGWAEVQVPPHPAGTVGVDLLLDGLAWPTGESYTYTGGGDDDSGDDDGGDDDGGDDDGGDDDGGDDDGGDDDGGDDDGGDDDGGDDDNGDDDDDDDDVGDDDTGGGGGCDCDGDVATMAAVPGLVVVGLLTGGAIRRR